MTKQLKNIILAIAKLPATDQRWILKQLTPAQRTTFKQFDGLIHLKHAQRFRALSLPKQPVNQPPEPLPDICTVLMNKSPIYIAIVLEQGLYPWKATFLQQFDKDNRIKDTLEQKISHIRPLVKQALFNEWEKNLSFESFLENTHG